MSTRIGSRSVILFALFLLSGAACAAEDFSLPDVAGAQHRLADYRGKWVVVNYWATWCTPCLEELPELEEFHARHKDKDVVVLGVNMEDIDTKNLREFIDDYFITFTILRGGANHTSPLGPIYGLPSTYVIAPDGEIAATHLGRVNGAKLEKFIENGKQSLQRRAANAAADPAKITR